MDKIILEIYKQFKEQRLTEAELSEKTGIPQATIHRLITGGNKKLDMGRIKKVQEALGIVEQPQTISEQIGEGYGPEVKLVADYLEIKVKGKTAEERLAFVEGLLADIRDKYK